MRTCLHISDTHEEDIHKIVYDHVAGHPLKFDILFITGDITYKGWMEPLVKIRDQMDRILLEGLVKDIVFIPGNHDLCFEPDHVNYESAIKLFRNPNVTNIHLLIHEAKEIQGIKVFGSPWTPWFFDWGYNYYNPRFHSQSDGLIKGHELWADIPYDTQILMTHGPVAQILDVVKRNSEHVGCEDLLRTVRALPALRVFLCGHIHEAYGARKVDNVLYLNSSIMNLNYLPKNKPQEFDFYFGE